MVPALRDDFTIEPIFVRDGIGAPLRWTGAARVTGDPTRAGAPDRIAARHRRRGAGRMSLLAAIAVGGFCVLWRAISWGGPSASGVGRDRDRP